MDEAFDGDDLGVWIHCAGSVNITTGAFEFYKDGVSKASTIVGTGVAGGSPGE